MPEPDLKLERRRLTRQATSIAVAVAPFGVAFGALAVSVGLSVWQTIGFSALVFSGSAQFAAVSVIGDGGGALAAISAGLLLNVRSLAFGVTMAPDLAGPWWRRALDSQLMIDEAMAVGTTGTTPRTRRLGYLMGGGGVFLTWNLSTLVGAVAIPSTGTVVSDYGLDATIPAAFLALLWPRLADHRQARVALAGATIAAFTLPFVPPGLPILLAGLAILIARTPETASTAPPPPASPTTQRETP